MFPCSYCNSRQFFCWWVNAASSSFPCFGLFCLTGLLLHHLVSVLLQDQSCLSGELCNSWQQRCNKTPLLNHLRLKQTFLWKLSSCPSPYAQTRKRASYKMTVLSRCTFLQFSVGLKCWTPNSRPVISLGHQEGRRVFTEGPKFLKLCPAHFAGGRRTPAPRSYGPAKITFIFNKVKMIPVRLAKAVWPWASDGLFPGVD